MFRKGLFSAHYQKRVKWGPKGVVCQKYSVQDCIKIFLKSTYAIGIGRGGEDLKNGAVLPSAMPGFWQTNYRISRVATRITIFRGGGVGWIFSGLHLFKRLNDLGGIEVTEIRPCGRLPI